MSIAPVVTGRSTQVRLQLIVSGRTLELAQIGPGSIILAEPAELTPAAAEIVMYVDDFERRWEVYLPDGASAQSRRVRTLPHGAA